MRSFIALETPQEIKKEINKVQKNLSVAGIKARWVKPQNIHLTLAFLGSITPDKIKIVSNIIKQIAQQTPPIKLLINKIDCFPSPARPRVIFLSLEGEVEKLNFLANEIRQKLKKEKIWFDEKPFIPHLTLGRFKYSQNLTEILKKVRNKRVEFIGKNINFISSQLSPSGPIYKTLRKFSLIKAKNLVK